MAIDTNLPDTDAPHANGVDSANADPDATTAHAERGAEIETAARVRGYLARIERYDDAPDECTIYPAGARAAELPTTWITAESGSFVALEALR